jgi:hypothetical protein
MPSYQGCIKRCIKKKQGPIENPSPNRGSLFACVPERDIMLTKGVYDIQLKKQKKLHRRLGVFSGITKEKRLWTLPSVLGSLLITFDIIRNR